MRDVEEAQRALGKIVTIAHGHGPLRGKSGCLHAVNLRYAFVRVEGEVWPARCEPWEIELV